MRLAAHYPLRLLAFAFPLLLSGCGGEPEKSTLTLFVAASLTEVMQEVGEAFAEREGVELVYNFAGSGALAQQLKASPRADVFISASERWMDEVETAGRLLEGTRQPLLSNRLVVVANARADYELSSASGLCELRFSYLAMGDPDSVPAGRYAKAFLESVDCVDGSAWEALRGRISPAPDVRAALAQVAGSRDVFGIVYRTDAYARRGEIRTLMEAPLPDGLEISYPAAVLRESASPELAKALVAFLVSEQARGIFESAGFVMADREEVK